MRLVKPVNSQEPSTPSSSTPHLFKRNYAAELANALRALVSAADIITTIRLAQSIGHDSHRDIVYPTVYGRALTRLFDALLGVTFAPSVETTLEIHDCPLMHLQESVSSSTKGLLSGWWLNSPRFRWRPAIWSIPSTVKQQNGHNWGNNWLMACARVWRPPHRLISPRSALLDSKSAHRIRKQLPQSDTYRPIFNLDILRHFCSFHLE